MTSDKYCLFLFHSKRINKSLFNRITSTAILITVLFFVFHLAACKKYLDKKSNNSLIVPSTINDLQAILDDGAKMNELTTPSFGESSADDYFLLPSTYTTLSERFRNVYVWQPYEYFYSNDWSIGYLPIYNSNLCLEILQTIPTTQQNDVKWNNVMGSALFFRSYYYLHLLWTYSKAYDENSADTDLGIVLRMTSDFDSPSSRSNVRDCYNKVIDDTKEALSYLPDFAINLYRPSKVAAYGLLARAYLSMRKYDSAFKYSNLCLQLKNQLINFNGDPDLSGLSSNTPFIKFNKETLFYTEMNSSVINHATTRGKIDTALYLTYNSNDLRRQAYYKANSGYQQFKGSYAQSTTVFFTGIATDEMYLTRAECFARLGNKDAAISDLNILLSKRWKNGFFVPLTASNSQEALNKILTERRKELLMRGLRWIDIKRLNKEGANIILKRIVNGQTSNLNPNDNKYALPLPSDIIKITGMEQN